MMQNNTTFYNENKDKRINELCLIGTHDSACSQILYGGTNAKLVKILNPIRFFVPYVNDVVKDWTLTQSNSFLEQLEMGVRAFDIRVSVTNNDEFYFSHTFFCIKAEDALQNILHYMETNPLAFIVLVFRFDTEHPYTYEQKNTFRHLIYTTFNTRLVTRHDNSISFPLLSSCIANGQQIYAAFINDASSPDEKWWFGGEYFNGAWIQDLDDELFYQNVRNFIQNQHVVDAINHIPIVKTPTTDTIVQEVKNRFFVGGYHPQSLRTWSHHQLAFLDRLKQDSIKLNFEIRTNIMWVDFVVDLKSKIE